MDRPIQLGVRDLSVSPFPPNQAQQIAAFAEQMASAKLLNETISLVLAIQKEQPTTWGEQILTRFVQNMHAQLTENSPFAPPRETADEFLARAGEIRS